jgi:pyocin large subunit-like protein
MLAFFLSPVGRWLGGLAVVGLALAGIYAKGRYDGRTSYKAKVERQINDAIKKGDNGRADALRELDAGELSNDWFRD